MITPKSLEELQSELALLQAELATTRKHAAERATLAYTLQSVQTKVILGQAELHELEAAKVAQEKSIESLLRVPMLEQAVKDAEQAVENSKHRARVEHVNDIKDRFQTTYDDYKQRSKETLELFRELQRLDTQYRGLARTGSLPQLLDPYQRELNLPAVTGPLSARSNFSTGQE